MARVQPGSLCRGAGTPAFGQGKAFLGHDPLSGHWFVFHNRARDRLKILTWEEDGWAIWYKRPEEGVSRFPAASGNGPRRVEVRAAELAMLRDGVVLEKVQRRKRYHRPATAK
jgi:transposase